VPDVELAVRDYLRADSGVSALASNRVFYGVPKAGAPATFATVQRIGGGDDPSEAPVDLSLVQIDCWAQTKAVAQSLRDAVRTAFLELRPRTQGSTVLYGAEVISDIWLPDPDSDRPRYSVTAQVTCRAA
jgi:hypothetical protein